MAAWQQTDVPVTFWVPDPVGNGPVRTVRIDKSADAIVTSFNLETNQVEVTSFGDTHQHFVFGGHEVVLTIEERYIRSPARLVNLTTLQDMLFDASPVGFVLQVQDPLDRTKTTELTELRLTSARFNGSRGGIELNFVTLQHSARYTGAPPIPKIVQNMPGGISDWTMVVDDGVIEVDDSNIDFKPVRRRLPPRNQ